MVAKISLGLMLISTLIGIMNGQSVDVEQQQECPQICPDNYDPVCVTDGKRFLEFANQCEFKTNKCHSQNESLNNFTPSVLDMCRTEFVSNLDKLLTKLGDLDLTKSGCLKPCAKTYKPVCISNGKYRFQASNRCIMDTINCGLGDKDPFKILKFGSCSA